MSLPQTLESQIAAALGRGVRINLRSEWASAVDGHRLAIREAATATLANRLHPDEIAALSNLSEVPRLKSVALSISHCQSIGGFAWSSSPSSLGFDVETSGRSSERTFSRMATASEISAVKSAGVSFTGAWSAKEAVFKAMPESTQPKVLSQFEIGTWARQGELFRFAADGGNGVVWEGPRFVIALFSGVVS